MTTAWPSHESRDAELEAVQDGAPAPLSDVIQKREEGPGVTEVHEGDIGKGKGDKGDERDHAQREGEVPDESDDPFVKDVLQESQRSSARAPPSKRFTSGWMRILHGFWLLGFVAFGGPIAHLGMFEREFVERRGWLSMEVFTEMIALGQCLPGPTSTQIAFALGTTQEGLLGGILSGCLFLFPGFFLQIIAGVGAAEILERPSIFVRCLNGGLSATGIALVWAAAVGLGRKTMKDKVTIALGVLSAVVSYYHGEPYIFPTLIVFGGLTTIAFHTYMKTDLTLKDKDHETTVGQGIPMWLGGTLIAAWLSVLLIVVVWRSQLDYEDAKALFWFESFYRTGSMIFGGGQVVLPLILEEVSTSSESCSTIDGKTVCDTVVEPTIREGGRSWVSEEEFLAGLAISQSFPGPLFNFSSYLGWLVGEFPGALLCWLGLFSPGVILIFGLLPFWKQLRKASIYRRALPGLNASAAGLVFAACASLCFKALDNSPFVHTSVCIGMIGFALIYAYKLSAPLVVITGGILGIIGWATDMR
ncbi:unnamed protein product [Vitrella brassicaformis CCMP3155]|uniref:Chromate transporter n=1 Tax=Vitrella brassicaformis (strain CCMP3155) TaxID=1169540 RepID=A0A0G4H7X8_VITBC|nr:unnamed protein product [Vitrella brassicaformis CCMP3155]|eukprot:CEM39786.1 unnamed protein product [Vitrella brassicaformis CCMP3155]